MADWLSPDTAPKGRIIIGDIGLPWAALVTWSEYADKWVVADLQWNVCEGLGDPGFVTEYETELKGWMELPEVMNGLCDEA